MYAADKARKKLRYQWQNPWEKNAKYGAKEPKTNVNVLDTKQPWTFANWYSDTELAWMSAVEKQKSLCLVLIVAHGYIKYSWRS